ncbi:MAG: FtsX-like permease family protein [Pseudomonadota bacterium]
MKALLELLRGDVSADRVVPPTGFTTVLTLFSAAAMAFLAVFVMALAMTAGRQAASWDTALAGTATVQVTGSAEELLASADAVEALLGQTPGIGATRILAPEEQQALLAPWFGAEFPVEVFTLPLLIEVRLSGEGPNVEALRARLAADVPGARYDDHGAWRMPMVEAANALRRVAITALVLILAVTAATIALAASAALAANGQVIDVLRLIGADDSYITRAFVRRFTLRAFAGAGAGAAVGLFAVILVPNMGAGGMLSGVGFTGAGWLWPLLVPPMIAAIAFAATRLAAGRRLAEVS